MLNKLVLSRAAVLFDFTHSIAHMIGRMHSQSYGQADGKIEKFRKICPHVYLIFANSMGKTVDKFCGYACHAHRLSLAQKGRAIMLPSTAQRSLSAVLFLAPKNKAAGNFFASRFYQLTL